jgi:hypothetical protein
MFTGPTIKVSIFIPLPAVFTTGEQSIKTDRSLTIGQLGISSLLRLDLKLMYTPVKAAVDTAAEVSI